MTNQTIVISLLFFFLCGCVEKTTKFAPEQIISHSTYTQAATGVSLPIHFEHFNRVFIKKYDAQATHIIVGYNHKKKPIALTLYIYPAPQVTSFGSPQAVIDEAKENLFYTEFEKNLDAIKKYHKDCDITVKEPYHFRQKGIEHKGLHAEILYFEVFEGSFQNLISHLYLFQSGDFLYKYRITYPKTMNAKKEIEDFITKFKLKNKKT